MKMKLMVFMVGLMLMGANLYAADGDLIVNGNVGVGTTTPTQKLDVNGNVKGTGLCIGANCTTTLHVVGGLYGYCSIINVPETGSYCSATVNPATCSGSVCSCTSGYSPIQLGAFYNTSAYACLKN